MFIPDNNVPIPTKPLTGSTKFIRSLEVGQSFTADPKMRNAVHAIANRLGYKITTAKENDLIRIWRIS